MLHKKCGKPKRKRRKRKQNTGDKKLPEQMDPASLLQYITRDCGPGKAIDNLALTCSQIIRKSIPRVCLPIPSLNGPVHFDESSVDDIVIIQEMREDSNGEEDEEPEVVSVPLPLSNIEDFLKFFPEITQYQEYRKEYLAQVPQTPTNSQNEMSDEQRSDPGPISVTVTPVHENGGVRGQGPCSPATPALGVTDRRRSRNGGAPSAAYSISRSAGKGVVTSPVLSSAFTPIPAISVKKFVKVAAPDIYGHRPPVVSEPLHEAIPSVQRTLLLLDIARTVHPDTLMNRIAYDMDELMKSEGEREHARSIVKWDMGLQRCKILPSLPQAALGSTGDPTLEEVERQLGGPVRGSSTVNIPTLGFESRFECGNLRKAIQVRIFEYDLVLNSDIGSSRHHQWFYFEVKNMVADFPYRFNIINCEKGCSSFTQGMQPLLYSTNNALTTGAGWVRTGKRICYYRNNFIRRPNDINDKVYATVNSKNTCPTMYTLTFTICFPHSHDTCYIAYHYPYSYTSLQAHLLELQHITGINKILRRQQLCTSVGGNAVDLLTITQFPISTSYPTATPIGERSYVVLTARIHPGECNSSWVMKGVIEFLLSDNEKAIQLRNAFIFKIIPMLNIDGVVNGSHRCSLLGVDMNRQWINPLPHLFPSLYHTKGLMQLLVGLNRRPVLYCDFHGHSRKKNVFMYGNITNPTDNATVKLLPTILDIHAPVFSFNNCCFTVEKSRESTARVALWRQYEITRSYTLESTYCGADQGPYKGCQVGTQHLEEMGAKFCEAILIMASADQPCCVAEPTDDDNDSLYSSETEGSDSDDDSSA